MNLIPPGLSESDIVPFSTVMPPGENVLVLSPHPDDETLGCGGSLKILLKSKKTVRVLFLTNGDKADPETRDIGKYASLREKEAAKAMGILGISGYEFLRFPDRGLYSSFEQLGHAVEQAVSGYMPDTVYSPSPAELNPDHRAAALTALNIMGRYGTKTVFYEIVTPIRPNILVDISNVFNDKKRAVKAYKSQLKITDYLKIAGSLNIYRTLTAGRGVKYAEALWLVSDISKFNASSWLGYSDCANQEPVT